MTLEVLTPAQRRERRRRFVINNAIYGVVLVLFAVIIYHEPRFLSFNNFRYILTQSSTRIIMALGVGGIIVLGGTDLSVGRMIGMSAVVTASLLQTVGSARRIYPEMARLPIWQPILLVMGLCAFFSLLHGISVFKFKVAPFIASLAIQLIVYGSMSLYFEQANSGSPIGNLDKDFTGFAQGAWIVPAFHLHYVVAIPLAAVIGLWALMWLLGHAHRSLRDTRFVAARWRIFIFSVPKTPAYAILAAVALWLLLRQLGSIDGIAAGFAITRSRIPYILAYAAIATAVVWVVWNKTELGKNMFAIGGNKEAATVCGVNILWNAVLIYVVAGLLYGFAGSLECARTGSATNGLGQGYELDSIASCVVGGVSMRGGVGSISGVVTGVLLFQIINYGLVFIGVSPYIQYIVKGAIILFAVAIDTQKYEKKK